jgi:hypothetical protein
MRGFGFGRKAIEVSESSLASGPFSPNPKSKK